MSKIGRNDLCPCGSGKKHKKCCSAPELNQLPPQSSANANKPPTFKQSRLTLELLILTNPRNKTQQSPAKRRRRNPALPHPDDAFASNFVNDLTTVLSVAQGAADAWHESTGTDIFQDLINTLAIDPEQAPDELTAIILPVFALLRHATYTPETKEFFNSHITRELQDSPELLDLYLQLAGQPFDVWGFSPRPGEPLFALSRKSTIPFDGFFSLALDPISDTHLATLIRWQEYEFLLGLGFFDPVVPQYWHEIIDINDPTNASLVEFHHNEHTALRAVADPFSDYVARPPFGHPRFFGFAYDDEPSFHEILTLTAAVFAQDFSGDLSAVYEDNLFALLSVLHSYKTPEDWNHWQTDVRNAYQDVIQVLIGHYSISGDRLHEIAPFHQIEFLMRSDAAAITAIQTHARSLPATILLGDDHLKTLGIDPTQPVSALENNPSPKLQELIDNYLHDITIAWLLGLHPDNTTDPILCTLNDDYFVFDFITTFASPQFLQRPITELPLTPQTSKRLLKSLSAHLNRAPDALQLADLPHAAEIRAIPGIGDVTHKQLTRAVRQHFATFRHTLANLPTKEPAPKQQAATQNTLDALSDIAKLF